MVDLVVVTGGGVMVAVVTTAAAVIMAATVVVGVVQCYRSNSAGHPTMRIIPLHIITLRLQWSTVPRQ